MKQIELKKIKIKSLYKKLLGDEEINESESSEIIYEINNLSPDPEINTYIFGKEYEHLTIDEIIEKAFSYKPIILGDQSQKDPE